MKLIAHRGNVDSRQETRENKPDYIQAAVERGFDVEIDVWYTDKKWHLGHDNAQYLVEESFLKNKSLWCHAKNIEKTIIIISTKIKKIIISFMGNFIMETIVN